MPPSRVNHNEEEPYSRKPYRVTPGCRNFTIIALDGSYTQKDYPEHLRRIRLKDPDRSKTLGFLSNQFDLPPLTSCALYKNPWQVELFFKWIKQHLLSLAS